MKIHQFTDSKRISKKKTHVKKRTLNPVYNETFVFELPVPEDGLSSTQLELTMFDWDRLTRNEVIVYFQPYTFLHPFISDISDMNTFFAGLVLLFSIMLV